MYMTPFINQYTNIEFYKIFCNVDVNMTYKVLVHLSAHLYMRKSVLSSVQ